MQLHSGQGISNLSVKISPHGPEPPREKLRRRREKTCQIPKEIFAHFIAGNVRNLSLKKNIFVIFVKTLFPADWDTDESAEAFLLVTNFGRESSSHVEKTVESYEEFCSPGSHKDYNNKCGGMSQWRQISQGFALTMNMDVCGK